MAESTGWSLALAEELRTRSGRNLKTLDDARAFAIGLDSGYSTRQHWQRAAELLMQASATGKVRLATRQVKLALMLDGMLKV
jgi:hypothetical protein